MTTYPIEIQRCRHIRTNGTQCGSPALKAKELCYFHNHNQPREVELYLDGERYCDRQIMLPVFEDAHSIQTMIRLVVQLLMSRRIERKDASLLLYALQIASGNLKTMHAERPKPTHMVVEPEKASATPLGMTPWSATGQGHDPEQEEDQEKNQEEDKRPPHADPTNDHLAPGTIQACQRPEPVKRRVPRPIAKRRAGPLSEASPLLHQEFERTRHQILTVKQQKELLKKIPRSLAPSACAIRMSIRLA